MLLTSPFARTALLLALATIMAALMVVRVTVGREQGVVAPETRVASLTGHSPASGAHARHEYRLRVAAASGS